MKRSKQRKSPAQRGRPTSPWRSWLLGAGLVVLVTIVYGSTLDNGFIWDDDDYVEKNATLTSLPGLLSIWFKLGSILQYYPLVHSTFWAEYHLWGLDPRGYHVVNLLLHATSVVLVWRLLLRLAVPGAWLAAAIFAVHPVGVESVAWVTERKNVLSCALALGSLLAYLRFSPAETPGRSRSGVSPRGDAWRYYALALGLYVAALLSKTVTASVPAVLLVIYWWKRGRVTWRDAAPTAPFFAVGLALSLLTVWMEKTYVGASGEEFDLSLVERVLIAGRALWFYAGKLLWPHPLIFFYPRWTIDAHVRWQYLFPAAALAVVVGLWLARQRIGRGSLAAVLIFAGVLVPALGFFNVYPFCYSFVADHFQYHASIALIALAAAALALTGSGLVRQVPWVAPLAVVGVLLPLGVVAHQRTHVYKDLPTLHGNTIALNPTAWVARQNLGTFLYDHGKYDEAIAEYRKAIVIREKLVRDQPTLSAYQDGVAGSYEDLATAQQKSGRPAEAEASHRKALEIREQVARDNPAVGKYKNNVAATYVDIGLVQREMGRTAESEGSFRKAIAIREKLVRDHPTATRYQDGLAWCYVDLASAQQKAERPADAEASYGKALEIREKLARDNPAVGTYKNNLAASYVDVGIVQRDMGRSAEAESSFQGAIAIREKLVRDDPTQRDYQDGLAWCYVQLVVAQYENGRPAEAEVSCRKAIAIREKLVRDHPAVDDYKHQLAVSYRDLANLQRATGPEKSD